MRQRRLTCGIAFAGCLVTIMASATAVFAAPGAVDVRFGDGGTVQVQTVEDGFDSEDVYVRPDGTFTVVGGGADSGYGEYTGAVNFSPAGRLMPTAGNDGGTLGPSYGRLGDSGRGSDGTIATLTTPIEGTPAVSLLSPNGEWGPAFDVAGDHPRGVVPVPGGVVVAGTDGTAAGDVVVQRYSTDGVLDSSFGVESRVVVDLGGTEEVVELLTRPDGRLLVVMSTTAEGVTDAAVAQFTATGRPDATFGSAGVARVDLGASDDRVTAAVLRTDGKLVVGGAAQGNLALVRLNASGALDTTFDGDGRVLASGLPAPVDLAAPGSGATAAVGGVTDTAYAARFTTAGKADTSFSGDGRAKLMRVPEPGALGQQADGSLLVLNHGSVRLARISPGGVESTSFGRGGTASYWFERGPEALADVVRRADGSLVAVGTQQWPYQGESGGGGPTGFTRAFGATGAPVAWSGGAPGHNTVTAAAAQTNGQVVVAGASYEYPMGDQFYVTRLNADGSRDRAFVSTGTDAPAFSMPLYGAATAVAVRTDGRIVAAGYRSDTETGGGLVVVRLLATGAPDLSFSGDGIAFFPTQPPASGLALVPDGRIMVSGTKGGDLAAVRLTATGTLDRTFSGDGIATIDVGEPGTGGDVVAVTGGKVVLAGTSPAGMVVARLSSGGVLDSTFGTGGIRTVANGQTQAITVDSTSRLLLAGGSPAGATLARLTPNGALDATFGSAGVMTLPAFRTASAVTSTPEGYVVAGTGGAYRKDGWLARVNAN